MKPVHSVLSRGNTLYSPLFDRAWFYESLLPPRCSVSCSGSVRWIGESSKDVVITEIPQECAKASSQALPSRTACKTAEETSVVRPNYVADASEMKVVFEKFDENSDGLISRDELKCFMHKLGFQLSDEDLTAMVKTVDGNGDGVIDFDEFFSLYKSFCADGKQQVQEDEEDNLLQAFRVFDLNNDGFITVHELQVVLLNLGLEEGRSLLSCSNMIRNVDGDGDGQVNFEEFKQMMLTKSF